MILQKKCTFHPPACILVRFILAHSFRLTEKERSNVTAKYTKTPLWILLREKRNTQNPNTDPCVREREISLNQIWPNCSSKQGNTETVTFLWCWCVTAIITNLFCCTATFLLLLQLLMPWPGRTLQVPYMCFVWTTVFFLCWQMLWWKTVQEIRKGLLYDFFLQISFLPARVSMMCTGMPTITCKAPCLLLGFFFYAALGWLIKNNKPQKLVWTYNPNRGHPFWEEFWPQGFDHEQPFQLSYRFGILCKGQMLPSAAFPSHCKAPSVLWPREALDGFGASPVQWLGTSQCLAHFRLLATPTLNSQKNLLTHRWD